LLNMSRSRVVTAAAVLLLGACTRAPVGDGVTSRADNNAPVQARPAAEAPVASTRLLPPADALDDGVITARIRVRLLADPAMGGADVSVNTDHGIVSLTGTVSSREQAAIALEHAQSQDGVMRVDDHLAVALQ